MATDVLESDLKIKNHTENFSIGPDNSTYKNISPREIKWEMSGKDYI